MYRPFAAACLLATSALTPTYASAQESAKSDSEVIAEMKAQLETMQARIDELERRAEERAAAVPTQAAPIPAPPPSAKPEAETAIAFKGAPEIKAPGGWSFKPRGRVMIDAGTISAPDGIADGFGSEARRVRLGVQGDIPGGFGYKIEADFAGDEVALTDALLSYEAGDLELTVGQFNNFQSMEELTSSLNTSFIERAAFTDAFGFERKVGIGAEYGSGDMLLQVGAFTDNSADLPDGTRSYDARIVFMPEIGGGRLHLGGSVHQTDFDTGATTRFRQRPLVHFTSVRPVNTGNIGADSQFGYGAEAAYISGPFHLAGEAFWQNVDRPGALADPTFFGAYAEAGVFLTRGDTRGYKGGKFDRIKPANPVGKGGIGAIQFNLRYDHLDLSDAGIVGGTQDGYFASLIWTPATYTRFMINYGRLEYTDAAIPTAGGATDYGIDVIGARAQIDF